MTTSSQECSPAVSPVPQIRSFPHRIIRPLADKEAIQRNFVTLPNRAANFSSTFFLLITFEARTDQTMGNGVHFVQ